MGAASTQAGGTGMVIIDTLAAARELEAVGIEPKHAEAIVSIQRRTAGELATKTDLGNAVSKLATKANLQNFATKDDLKNFATKDDLKNFATKIALDAAVSKLATKAELDAAVSKLATKAELDDAVSRLATKAELREFKSELELKIEKAKFGLSRWMMTGWVAQTGVLATLYWYFSSGLPGD